MYQKPDLLMAGLFALPMVLAFLPFIVMGRVGLGRTLRAVVLSAIGVLAMSILAALLSSCSFEEAFFLARPTHECGPIPMLRAVFAMYVLFLASAASLPFVAIAAAIRHIKRPNPAVKRRVPYLRR